MKLICYLSNGYPSIESSKKMAEEYVDAGCDMIEIDFPARDPFLESEYLANRMQVDLEACDDYKKYMEAADLTAWAAVPALTAGITLVSFVCVWVIRRFKIGRKIT